MALLSRLLITANRCHSKRILVQRISSRNISTSCHCLAGIVSQNADNKKVTKPKIKSQEVWRLLSLAKPEKYSLGGGIGMLFLSSGITMAIPFSLGKIIDIIFTDSPTEMVQNLTNFSMVLGGIFAVGAALNFGRTYLMGLSSLRITQTMRKDVYSAIVKQEIAFFDRNKTGELINRLSADTSLVSQCVTSNIADGIRSMSLTLAGVGMMFYMSPKLALVGLGVVPPVAIMAIVYGRYVRKLSKTVQDSLAGATQVAEERIGNIRTVRAFGQENREFNRYNTSIDQVLDLGFKETKAKAFFFALTGLSGNVIILSVLYYGGLMVTESSLTAGQLSAFLLYAVYVTFSLSGLSTAYSEMMKGIGASTRIWQLVDKKPLIPISGGLVIPSQDFAGSVHFNNVTFAYPSRQDANIFSNLNLDVPAGSVTAVVGSSGSGKSTLASLLLRFYDPQGGLVTVDGRPVDQLDPQWLRAHIGTVSQEPSLFSCSIRDNILYGAVEPDQVTEEQLIQAAVEANAWSFIQSCPEGLDTIVGERGVLLSGGQRQRIAIARAIVKNPRILLLDEATSALDAESESLVQEALERVMKGRTVLTIAHRLSTIRKADRIAVLEHGQVVELGPYESLMAIPDGVFRRLVERQTIGLAP